MNIILIFGDSIVVGRGIAKDKSWASRIAQHFDVKNKWNTIVYNLGIPGESTSELLKRFTLECETRIQQHSLRDSVIIVIAEGINDSKGVGFPQSPKTSLKDSRQNTCKLIRSAKKYTERLIFVGLTPIDENKTTTIDGNYFLNSSIKSYNSVIKNTCKIKDVSFVEILDDWSKVNYKEFLSDDGIHPNELGHRKIFAKIKPLLTTN